MKAGDPVEPLGVIVADIAEVVGAALWVLRLRRR